MQQRLDQIEDEFETVKQLLMSAASYAESANRRLDRVAEQQELNTSAIAALGVKQERTQQQLDRLGERVDHLTAAQNRTQQQLDTLSDNVDRLSGEISEMRVLMEASFQQAEQDRNQAAIDRAEFRTTVEQLLQVLVQRFNGNGRSGE